MALADKHRVKRYLRIRAGNVREDATIDELLKSVKAMIETFLALLSQERATATTTGRWPTIRSYRRSNEVGTASVTTITLTTLAAHPEYSTRIEPALNQDIVDFVAHLYKNRSPNATSESSGGGISEGWDDVGPSGLPKRVERRIRNLVETIDIAA
jgi:hypothetical protein